MGVPAVLATAAACGSLVTSIKSSWELRRMIKRKQEAKECEEEAPYVFRRLRRDYYDGLMGTAEYEQWYERFLVAKVEKDCEFSPTQAARGDEQGGILTVSTVNGMRRIRAHLRILENGAPVAPNQRSRAIEQRRHSVSYSSSDSSPVGFPQSRASLQYRPDQRANVGARPDQFVRFDKNATYSRASSDASSTRRSRGSSVRHESRGRIERRYDSYDSSGDSGDSEYYSEKRPHRGRSLHR